MRSVTIIYCLGVGGFWLRHDKIYLTPLKALKYSYDPPPSSFADNWRSTPPLFPLKTIWPPPRKNHPFPPPSPQVLDNDWFISQFPSMHFRKKKWNKWRERWRTFYEAHNFWEGKIVWPQHIIEKEWFFFWWQRWTSQKPNSKVKI